jgi:hypothetical protein
MYQPMYSTTARRAPVLVGQALVARASHRTSHSPAHSAVPGRSFGAAVAAGDLAAARDHYQASLDIAARLAAAGPANAQ